MADKHEPQDVQPAGKRDVEATADEPVEERRKERRFPAVGLTLLFSPGDNSLLQQAGQLLREATAIDMSLYGLSFDVREPVASGEKLYIQIEDPAGGPAEQLLTEVKWCRKIDDAHFRIGTRITAAGREPAEPQDGGGPGDREPVLKPIGKGPEVPSGAEFLCPSCRTAASFTFIGMQPGPWQKGVLPLYQCSACESSRTIAQIMAYNRDRAQLRRKQLARRRARRRARKR